MEVVCNIIARKIMDESLDSSESDSDSNLELLITERQRHAKINHYVHIIEMYSDVDFKSHFRLSRNSVEVLIQEVGQKEFTTGRMPMHVKDSVLLTIWVISNQESFRSVADRFGISKGNAHAIFIEMCKKISKVVGNYISWPMGQSALKNVHDFNELRGRTSFPEVFGCVDCTHIPIPGPINDNSFYNRKGFHSILLQGICDSKQEFIDVFCGWPGSAHDCRMWQNSPIYDRLIGGHELLLRPNTYLLGDSAYALKVFLMVPFRDNGNLSRSQRIFNRRLSSSRVVIEQSFGRLKGLFRRLKYLHVTKLEYTKFIILTACILHNISLRDGVVYEEEYSDDGIEEPENDREEPLELDAVQLRNSIMNALV